MLIFFKLVRRGILLSAIAIAAVLSGCEETELTAAAPESKTAQSELTLTVVDNKGQPIAGAMVTMQSDALRRVTRFTDGAGKLELSPLPNGELLVRYPGMGERRVPGSDAAGNVIALSADPQFLRKLPSSQWLELLPDGPWKKEFIVNCGTCHEIGYDRIMMGDRPRNEGEWLAAIKMMRAMDAYEVIPPDFDDEAYAGWLADNLSQSRIASLNSAAHQAAGRLAGVEITEYTLPEQDSLPHDLVVGPDGLIWITAFFYDQIWALNPDTGDTQIYPVDDSADVNAQPRALKFDNEGQLWIVNGGTQSVLRLDPESGDYLQVPVDMYAHSLDIDPEGNIWVNDYFAAQERVARVDADTQEVTVYPLPPAQRPENEGLPLPYGLQVDNLGRLYSTQLTAGTLARYDTRGGKGTLLEMPMENSGPRRPALDRAQRLWIPEFNTGYVSIFDPEIEAFERIRFGSPSLGMYDIEINQETGDVWATGSLASSLLRYRPDTQDLLHIPMPTEPAFTRHLAVDERSGDVWTAYSSLPAAKPKAARVRVVD